MCNLSNGNLSQMVFSIKVPINSFLVIKTEKNGENDKIDARRV